MPGFTRLWIVNFSSRHQRLQHVGQHLGIRTSRQSTLLRPAQFCRRDHLHGLGDLPRVGHAANAPPDVENVWHGSVVSLQSPVVSHSSLAVVVSHWPLAVGLTLIAKSQELT